MNIVIMLVIYTQADHQMCDHKDICAAAKSSFCKGPDFLVVLFFFSKYSNLQFCVGFTAYVRLLDSIFTQFDHFKIKAFIPPRN